MKPAWLGACALVALPAYAAVIEGQIRFPGETVPSMRAYAYDESAGQIRTAAVAADQAKFVMELPPGRYIVFLAPSQPGTPHVYGGYTRFSLCMAQLAEAGCDDHTPVSVVLATQSARATVRIDDWYLTDAIIGSFDRVVGSDLPQDEPLGAPHFSEYKVTPTESDSVPTAAQGAASRAAPQLDFGAIAQTAEVRFRLQIAMAGGPNFAGHYTAALAPCGTECERLLLVDWRDGKVSAPQAVPAVQGPLPCRSEQAALFRRDSRLLSVSRPHGDRVVTEYYLWTPDLGALVLHSRSERDASEFCSALPP
jgi:hypothetical protein